MRVFDIAEMMIRPILQHQCPKSLHPGVYWRNPELISLFENTFVAGNRYVPLQKCLAVFQNSVYTQRVPKNVYPF
jgi:hypothetical protein